jgi:hypothetical protein
MLKRKTLRCLLGVAGLGLLVAGTAAVAQDVVRVRDTIERVEGGIYIVKARDGSTLKLTLAPNAGVAASVRSALSDIKSGSYIGVAALSQGDGSQRALEVHVFHESMRGTGEGHRPWDLQPKSTMTNATVGQVIVAADGPTLTVKYKDGEKRIVVHPASPFTASSSVLAASFSKAPSKRAVGTAMLREN